MPAAAQVVPVYWINLDRRPDRRAFMEEQFARLGIAAERIAAIEAAQVPEPMLAPHRDPANPWAISPIEIACRMSHEGAWARLLAGDTAAALVLEDDVVLGDSVPRFLAAAPPAGARLVKLETFREPVLLGRETARVAGRFALRPLLASHMGGGAYIVSRDLAARALADPRRTGMSLDHYLFARAGGIVPGPGVLQVEPAPCVQLERLRDDDPADLAASPLATSDLRPERRAQRRGRSASVLRVLRQQLDEARYAVRVALALLGEPEARRAGRRRVAFDPGP